MLQNFRDVSLQKPLPGFRGDGLWVHAGSGHQACPDRGRAGAQRAGCGAREPSWSASPHLPGLLCLFLQPTTTCPPPTSQLSPTSARTPSWLAPSPPLLSLQWTERGVHIRSPHSLALRPCTVAGAKCLASRGGDTCGLLCAECWCGRAVSECSGLSGGVWPQVPRPQGGGSSGRPVGLVVPGGALLCFMHTVRG